LLVGQGAIENPTTGHAYEVLNTLAQGGMSITYRVYDYQLHRLAVLKEISAELAGRAKAQELFQREAQSLQSLQHPGIPRFHDFFVNDNRYTLVMELVHGQTLDQMPKPSVSQALAWMIEVAEVLDYLHNRIPPMVHRDIKPANLILRHHPRQIVLIDFGAVKDISTPPGTRISTPGYSAMEQQRGTPCLQSDYYAIGTTLVFLLTRTFPGRFFDKQQGILVGLAEAGIPRPVVAAIEHLTALVPDHRPPTAQAVIEVLRPLLNQYANQDLL
jgi:serine/threonine protein kinase